MRFRRVMAKCILCLSILGLLPIPENTRFNNILTQKAEAANLYKSFALSELHFDFVQEWYVDGHYRGVGGFQVLSAPAFTPPDQLTFLSAIELSLDVDINYEFGGACGISGSFCNHLISGPNFAYPSFRTYNWVVGYSNSNYNYGYGDPVSFSNINNPYAASISTTVSSSIQGDALSQYTSITGSDIQLALIITTALDSYYGSSQIWFASSSATIKPTISYYTSPASIYSNGPVDKCINDSKISGCIYGAGSLVANDIVVGAPISYPDSTPPKLIISEGENLSLNNLNIIYGNVELNKGSYLGIADTLNVGNDADQRYSEFHMTDHSSAYIAELVVGKNGNGIVSINDGSQLFIIPSSIIDQSIGSQSTGGHGVVNIKSGAVFLMGDQHNVLAINSTGELRLGDATKGLLISEGYAYIANPGPYGYFSDVNNHYISIGEKGVIPQPGSLKLSGLLQASGGGNFITVNAGNLTTYTGSAIEFNLAGFRRGVDSSLANTIEKGSVSSYAYLKDANINIISQDSNWSNISPGDTIGLISAGNIDLGKINQVQRGSFTPNTSFKYGDTSFSVPLLNSNSIFMSPEILKVGCNALSGLLNNCSVDVLSLRAVKFASGNVSGATAIPDISTLADGLEFSKQSRTIIGANLSKLVYGQPISNANFVELSHIDIDGLRAYAYETQYQQQGGGEITIVIRGTDNNANLAANTGFTGIDSNVSREYLGNLSSFTASLLRANPNASIRYVGHSLGGGLAMVMGAMTGFEAYGFDAPPIGYLLDHAKSGMLTDEFAQVAGLINRGDDLHQLVNIRVSGDPVSSLPFPEKGLWITLAPNAFEYYVNNPSEALVADPTFGKYFKYIASQYYLTNVGIKAYGYHKMANLHAQLLDPESYVVDISYNGESLDSTPYITPAIADAIVRIIKPSLSSSIFVEYVNHLVKSGLTYFLDPIFAPAYIFLSHDDSPAFGSIWLPELGIENMNYTVQVFDNGQWIDVSVLSPGELFSFGEVGKNRFKLVLNGMEGMVPREPEVLFAVEFIDSGTFNGSITPVPEASTYMMFLVGILLLLWRCHQGHCLRVK